jgi:hypothetical protein
LLGGCEDGALSTDYRPVLATMHGSIVGAKAPEHPEELRVALVWAAYHDDALAPLYQQPVTVTSTWPADFQLDITELPPEAAMWAPHRGEDGGFPTHDAEGRTLRWAEAWVVAYRDVDHDGRLDLTPPTADAFVDELVAYNSHVVVSYADAVGAGPGTFTLEISDDAYADTEVKPIDTPISLTVTTDPADSCYLLDGNVTLQPKGVKPWWAHTVFECPDALSAPPEATSLSCHSAPDPATSTGVDYFGASWALPTSAFIAETCGYISKTCFGYHDPLDPTPDSWPCPCDGTVAGCMDY